MKKQAIILIFFLTYSVWNLEGQCLVITNPPAVCSPSTVDITVASVTAGSMATSFTYWTDAAATSSLSNPTAVGAGTYYILGAGDASCPQTLPVVVTVSPATVAGSISGSTSVCTGTNSTVLTLTGYTGSIVRWQSSTNNWVGSSNIINTTDIYTATDLTTTTEYRAVVQSGSCMAVNSVDATITVYDNFTSALSGGASAVCYNTSPGMLTAAGTGGNTPYTYQWYNTSGILISETNSTYTPPQLTSDIGYYCAVTSAGSCGTANTTTINVAVRPQITLAGASQFGQICSGLGAQINLTGLLASTNSSIAYSIEGTPQTPISGVNSLADGTASFTTPAMAAANNGKTFRITTVSTGSSPTCSATFARDLTLIVNSATIPTINGNATACVNSSNVYTTEPGMSSYEWTIPAGGSVSSGGDGFNTVTVTWTTSGSKNVSVNYTNSNSCTATSPTIKTVFASDLPVPAITGSAAACVNSTGNVYSTTPGMLSYTWTVSAGGSISSADDGNVILVNWNASGPQSVTLTYTNTSGCPASVPVVKPITVNPLPVPAFISGIASPRIGSTGNAYLTQSGMDTYIWTVSGGGSITGGGGSSDNSVTVTWNISGNQSLSVSYRNTNLCTAAAPVSFPVSVKALPAVSNVQISGTAAIGYLLTGSYTYNDIFSEGATTFRWLRNGTPIAGATLITYTPVAADLNNSLTFEVTPVSLTGPPYAGTPVMSTQTLPVEDLSGSPVADQVCIEGIRGGGKVLKGKYRYTYPNKAEGASTYRWLRNGTLIASQTGLQYTLSQIDDIDSKAEITFEVSPVSASIIPRSGTAVVSNPLARITLPQAEYSVAVSEVDITANQPGGVFSGPAVTNGKFSPSSAGTTGSPYTINYLLNIVNSATTCSQEATESVRVVVNTTAFVDVNPVYCQDGPLDVITVTGVPALATSDGFSMTDPDAIVSQTAWTVTIDPKKMSPGNNVDILYFYYIYGGYRYGISQPLVVESVSTSIKIINLNPAYCKEDPKKTISVINLFPAGGTGTWTGTLLSDKTTASADLNPKSGTAGTTYPVTYQYQSAGGCLSLPVTEMVKINPLPDPSFTIDASYNFDGGSKPLAPVQGGGTFSGSGVLGSRIFPDISGEGDHIIKYIIKDVNGCIDSLKQPTKVRKAKGTFNDLPSVICYKDTTFNIKMTNLFEPSTVNSFRSSKKSIVHVAGAKNADYNIPAAGAGIDTIFFSYKFENVDYKVYKIVNIDSLGQVTIGNLSPGDVVCNNRAPFELFTSYQNGFFTGPVVGGYLDPTKATGSTAVSYKYTNQKTGCSTSINIPFSIIAAPTISYSLANNCIKGASDSTQFINATTSAGLINDWLWEFSDIGGSKFSNMKDPSYLYKTGGIHFVTLTAKTTNNCVVTKTTSFDLGLKPVADFFWKKECLSTTDSLTLFDNTLPAASVASRTWNFFDGGPLLTSEIAKYPKKTTGYINVQYIVNTSYTGCSDTVTKSIYIRPTISLSADDYYENFESGNGGWVIYDESVTNWSFGKPNRAVINSASSGNNAWYTPASLTSQKVQSSIVSPCFDFTVSQRPMISMKLFKRFERDRDGAVLQYKIGDEPGWLPIGSLDDGILWYNSTLIKGNPGGQQVGWTIKGAPDTKWTESKHTMDELKGQKNVKFRIAYGSDGTSTESDGIAFDDIRIGERTRNVLIEHFVNSTSASSNLPTGMVNEIVSARKKDVINIQYHTNFPGSDDPFYNMNPGESGARTLYYGLIKTPYTFIDGGSNKPEFANRYDYNLSDIDSNDVTRRSLINPKFSIAINSSVTGGVLTVNGQLTALEDITSDNLTLYLAVTEKANDKYPGAGGVKFYNIFRKFIPDAGGISVKRSWIKGETFNISDKTWIIEKALNTSDIEVIAFIQNSVTKEMFQATSQLEEDLIVGIKDLSAEHGIDFSLYPNPASNRLSVSFGESLKSETDIRIYDIQGTIVRSFRAGSGESEFTVDGLGLHDGIYLVRVSSGGIDYGFRKLIISGN